MTTHSPNQNQSQNQNQTSNASSSAAHDAMMLLIWIFIHWRLVLRIVGILLLLLAVRSGLRALTYVLLVARVLHRIMQLMLHAVHWILVNAWSQLSHVMRTHKAQRALVVQRRRDKQE